MRWMLLGVLLLVSCGREEPVAPEGGTGGTAAAVGTGGIDPGVVRDFENAPVPPPQIWAGSSLRRAAQERGLFAGLPTELPALLAALPEAVEKARQEPGRATGGPAGNSWDASDAELRAAELGHRVRQALGTSTATTISAAWAAAGLPTEPLRYRSFRVVTVKVFGTGYVETVELAPESIAPPR